MTFRLCLVLSVLIVGLGCSAIAEPADAVSTSVCDLVRWGHEMNGKQVRLRALLSTDLTHFSFLSDPQCDPSSIDYDLSTGEATHATVTELQKTIEEIPISESHSFLVDVSGVFHWRPDWEPPASMSGAVKSQPRGLLLIERVWSSKRVTGD